MTTPEPSPEALAAAKDYVRANGIPDSERKLAAFIDAFRPAPVGDELAQMILADCTDTTPQAWIDAASALVKSAPASGTEEAAGVLAASAPSVPGDAPVGDVEAVWKAIQHDGSIEGTKLAYSKVLAAIAAMGGEVGRLAS